MASYPTFLSVFTSITRNATDLFQPFTWDFPRADIYELLSPDLLHQVIKGTFKDHLVTWVGEYLGAEHGTTKAKKIMADIDRRIAAVPRFPGLRRFPEGRGFKQWTGDDSKALMKVYLPAIEGHVPPQMLRAFTVSAPVYRAKNFLRLIWPLIFGNGS
ncbi:hypothetical protein B0H14DRAFT_2338731 [Mycena olivaceomarginata]|nr:hypothetical protein B0H14DRAFT_2338731 [Mycena olivaceomarginata]